MTFILIILTIAAFILATIFAYKNEVFWSVFSAILGIVFEAALIWRYDYTSIWTFSIPFFAYILAIVFAIISAVHASQTDWNDPDDPDFVKTVIFGIISFICLVVAGISTLYILANYDILPQYVMTSPAWNGAGLFWGLTKLTFLGSALGLIVSKWYAKLKPYRKAMWIALAISGSILVIGWIANRATPDATSGTASGEIATVTPTPIENPAQPPAVENTPVPPVEPTPIPTFTLLPVVDPYLACPNSSLGKHPDPSGNGQYVDLIYKRDPYPGVLCEFEVWFKDVDYHWFASGTYALVADWSHGNHWNAIGELVDDCPTGFECEGTWVAINDFTVYAGKLGHMYVYADPNAAVARFLGTPNEMTELRLGSFACEYVATQGHTNANIRVPLWVPAESGSIFNHSGCFGYNGVPGPQ